MSPSQEPTTLTTATTIASSGPGGDVSDVVRNGTGLAAAFRFTFFLTVKQPADALQLPAMAPLSDFDRGVLVGLLIGEGSFGGDAKQPQVTLRMHVRHEALFKWLVDRIPDSRLYGPYHHGGRSYYQWMARGRTLVRDVLPLLEHELTDDLDGYAAERMELMRRRYAGYIARERAREPE
jgi:hypothetical protein